MRGRLIATNIVALVLAGALALPPIARAEGDAEAPATDLAEVVAAEDGSAEAGEATDEPIPEPTDGDVPADVAADPAGEEPAADEEPAPPAEEEAPSEEPAAEADEVEPDGEEPAELTAQEVSATVSAAQKALDALAAKHKADVAPGRYRVTTLLGETLSLGVSGGSAADGGKVAVLETANATSQRWELQAAAGGYFTIRCVSSGKYLDISGSDAAAKKGAGIVQWSARDAAARSQLWVVVRASNGSVKLVSACPDADGKRLVLSVNGGKAKKGAAAVLGLEKSGTANDQLWKLAVTTDSLDALAAQHKGDVADGMYVLSSGLNPGSGRQLVLSVRGGKSTNKANSVIYRRTAAGGKAYEAWSVRHTAKGYVILTNCLTGKALQVSGGKAKKGAAVIQNKDYNGKYRSQLWVMVKQADGSCHLVSAIAGDTYLTVQVRGSKKKAGTRNVLAQESAYLSQRWTPKAACEQYRLIPSLNNKTFLVEASLDASMGLGTYKSFKTANKRVLLYAATNASSMQWKVTYDANGYAHLTNVNSGKQLGFKAGGSAAQVAGAFRWLVVSKGAGNYTLQAKTGAYAGRFLTLKGANTNSGATVLAEAENGAKNQLWQLDNMAEGLDGVDISGWNTGINYNVLGDFVIVKATEWNSDTKTYTSYNNYQDKADKALAAGKLIGFYHFATNPTTSKQSMAKQAKGFIDAVSVKDANGNYKYLGKAVLFLDWENTSYSTVESTTGVTWAKQWLDYVYKKTGIRPLIYMNKNCTNAYNWSSVAGAGYELWGAQYLDRYYTENPARMITSFVENPVLTSGWGAWGTPKIYQYTATCKLHGSKYYDVNKYYGTKTSWLKMAQTK